MLNCYSVFFLHATRLLVYLFTRLNSVSSTTFRSLCAVSDKVLLNLYICVICESLCQQVRPHDVIFSQITQMNR